MKALELNASPRDVEGKKVRFLRRQGRVPVNIYGHGSESRSLQIETHELGKIVNRAGFTHLISLKVEGEGSPRNVIIKEVQRYRGMGQPIHVSFYQVSMKEKIKVEVPLEFVGEAPAVKAKEGEMIVAIRHLEVECLPADIPEKITVDVTGLIHRGDSIHVRDLVLGKDISILAEPEELLARIEAIHVHVEEEVKKPEAEVVLEGAEGAEEAAPAEEGKGAKK
jgi:large subunit ribosomal protein L25